MSAGMSWEAARRVLCVRLDTIGDVLMTTPAIRAIKATHPAREVTLLTSSAGAGIAPLIPELDETIVYNAPWIKPTPPRADSGPDWEMIARLREARFDAAVIFTVYSQNPLPAAMLCYLAEIPLRLAHCHENPYQLLNPWVPDPEPAQGIRHEVQRHLDLVATVGYQAEDQRLSLRIPEGARQRVGRLLGELGLDLARPWLVAHPGATAPSRRYPPEQFAQALGMLAEDYGWQIILTGTGADEAALVAEIQAMMGAPAHALTNALSLAEFGALLAAAPLLLSNNTGPVHMAAALGTPVVDLYALTNPQHTPWMVPNRLLSHDVPCRWCYKSICPQGHHHCLRLIAPEQVVGAVLDLHASHAAEDGRLAMQVLRL